MNIMNIIQWQLFGGPIPLPNQTQYWGSNNTTTSKQIIHHSILLKELCISILLYDNVINIIMNDNKFLCLNCSFQVISKRFRHHGVSCAYLLHIFCKIIYIMRCPSLAVLILMKMLGNEYERCHDLQHWG